MRDWFVSARFRCVVVEADNIIRAKALGLQKLYELGVPQDTRKEDCICRPATWEEKQLHSLPPERDEAKEFSDWCRSLEFVRDLADSEMVGYCGWRDKDGYCIHLTADGMFGVLLTSHEQLCASIDNAKELLWKQLVRYEKGFK